MIRGGDELLLALRAPAARARPAPPRAAARPDRSACPISCASPSRSRPHAASTTASSPRSPRLRSRVSMLPRSGSIESVGSSASSCAFRRADAVPMRIPGRIASAPQSASRGSSRSRYAPTTRPVGIGRRHVLRRVHRDVDALLEQRLLELLDEDAARADLAERLRAVAVAGGRDRHERDLDARRAQARGSELGLREREPTAAAADADQHSATRLRTGWPHSDAPRGRTRTNAVGACSGSGRPGQLAELQRSSSPRPNRCRTASA